MQVSEFDKCNSLLTQFLKGIGLMLRLLWELIAHETHLKWIWLRSESQFIIND
jgi:hypothetical protein